MKERSRRLPEQDILNILAGQKTQLWELLDHDDPTLEWYGYDEVKWGDGHSGPAWYVYNTYEPEDGSVAYVCPWGKPGDRFWIREAWTDCNTDSGPAIAYKAGGGIHFCSDDAWPVEYERYPGASFTKWYGDIGTPGNGWRSSMHMPRWASRLTLEIVNVRVERIQDSTAQDAEQWVIPGASWKDNPWVFVVDFRCVSVAAS